MSKKKSRKTRQLNAARVKPIKQTHHIEVDMEDVAILTVKQAAPVADVDVTLEARKEPLLRRIKAALLALIGK